MPQISNQFNIIKIWLSLVELKLFGSIFIEAQSLMTEQATVVKKKKAFHF